MSKVYVPRDSAARSVGADKVAAALAKRSGRPLLLITAHADEAEEAVAEINDAVGRKAAIAIVRSIMPAAIASTCARRRTASTCSIAPRRVDSVTHPRSVSSAITDRARSIESPEDPTIFRAFSFHEF